MGVVLGYTRVSEREHRLLAGPPSLTGRPLTVLDQTSQLSRACEALGVALHDEIPTDRAPGGIDSSWGPSRPPNVVWPGQTRLRELLQTLPAAAVVISSLGRLSSFTRDVEWILMGSEGAPRIIALAEGLSTADAAGVAQAAEFLEGAAAERRARRAALPFEKRPARGPAKHSRAFEKGVWWERAAPSVRSYDSLEARRCVGLPNGRPSVLTNASLGSRIRSMRDAGMTLQAIADSLNADGVPTIRGGVKWRRSSLQNLPPAADHDDASWFP